MWIALFLAILAADVAGLFAVSEPDEIGCTTDQECAEYCPPPSDAGDPDCDGGPQS
jgi:hypothetical protein